MACGLAVRVEGAVQPVGLGLACNSLRRRKKDRVVLGDAHDGWLVRRSGGGSAKSGALR